MNVLLTGVGRMIYYINYFKEVVGNKGVVVVATGVSNPLATNMADKTFTVPYFFEENYIESIVNICKNEKIDYLFSLHDLEGPVLARNINKLKAAGVNPIVSDLFVIETCLDKYKTFEFLKLKKISTPNTWLTPDEFLKDKKYKFPVLLKPRFGYGSINHLLANNKEELYYAFNYLEATKNQTILKYLGANTNESCTIIQDILNGDEYGIEIVNNSKKEFVVQFHKRKIAMVAGETQGAQIIFDKRLECLGVKISQILGHIGMLDCDILFEGNIPFVLDINPRFGGQYPFTHAAGANIPKVIVSDFKIPIKNINVGETFIKYNCLVKIQNEF